MNTTETAGTVNSPALEAYKVSSEAINVLMLLWTSEVHSTMEKREKTAEIIGRVLMVGGQLGQAEPVQVLKEFCAAYRATGQAGDDAISAAYLRASSLLIKIKLEETP